MGGGVGKGCEGGEGASDDACLTTDGDVVRGTGGGRGRHPLGDRLPWGIEHQVCEGESAIIHSHQPEASVIFPCCCFQLQQPACKAICIVTPYCLAQLLNRLPNSHPCLFIYHHRSQQALSEIHRAGLIGANIQHGAAVTSVIRRPVIRCA